MLEGNEGSDEIFQPRLMQLECIIPCIMPRTPHRREHESACSLALFQTENVTRA